MESGSYYGRGIVKIFFQPGTDIGSAEADVTAISQTVLMQLPEKIPAPMIMKLEASSVPVITLELTSDTMTPSDLFKLAQIRVHALLVTVPGAIVPHPYGGMDAFVMFALDQKQLQAHHLSAMDVQNVLDKQNIVRPTGDQKIGRPTGWSRPMPSRGRWRNWPTSPSSVSAIPSSTCMTSDRCIVGAIRRPTSCWSRGGRPSSWS
jgi:multidrug efflux pump subunit AcrB